jgi:Tfp pilus assembly protein PilN
LLDRIAEIKSKENDYGEMLDRIAALLSKQTKVVAAEMDADQGVVMLSVTSDSIVAIADYAELLRREKWAKQVFVEKIQNNKKDSSSSTPDAATAQPYSTTVRVELQQEAGGGK